jgi:predicted CoA-binding protein
MPESLTTRIADFLEGQPHAVVGASADRGKYGNKVLRAYLQAGRKAYPVNPNATEIEGLTAYPSLDSLPEKVHAISIITPPPVTEQIVEQAGQLGIKHLWMQPGAQSEKAVARAAELGISVIAGDACALVVLGYRESA